MDEKRTILSLPTEIIFQILEEAGQKAIARLVRISCQAYNDFNNYLYLFNIKHYGGEALIQVAAHGKEAAVRRFLDLGADRHVQVVRAEEVARCPPAIFRKYALNSNLYELRYIVDGMGVLKAIIKDEYFIDGLFMDEPDYYTPQPYTPLRAAYRATSQSLHRLEKWWTGNDERAGNIHNSDECNLAEIETYTRIIELLSIRRATEDQKDKQEDFISAVREDDATTAQLLLDRGGIDLNWHYNHGSEDTALHIAMKWNSTSIIKLLLTRGDVSLSYAGYRQGLLATAIDRYDVEIVNLLLEQDHTWVDFDGRILKQATLKGPQFLEPLLFAVLQCRYRITDPTAQLDSAVSDNCALSVQILLAHPNIKPDTRRWSHEHTPLGISCSRGYLSIVELLLETKKVDVNATDSVLNTPLLEAVESGNVEICRKLLAQPGIRPNIPNYRGQTPLSQAVSNAHPKIVKLLLESDDVDPNLKNEAGYPPLTLAIIRNQPEIVKLLLESPHIDPNLRDKNAMTPLMSAIKMGRTEMVTLLHTHPNVDPNSQDETGTTPLMAAILNSGPETVTGLLSCDNVDPNHHDLQGQTPLLVAVIDGNVEIVKLLLACDRLDPNSPVENDESTLCYSISLDRTDIPKLLTWTENSNPDRRWGKGTTPLMMAIVRGELEMIEVMLRSGRVDVNIKDVDGNTALFYAALGENRGIVSLLLNHKGIIRSPKNNNGDTPADLTKDREIRRLLRQSEVKMRLKNLTVQLKKAIA